MEIEISDFTGCKIALFCEDRILTILRDDKASIPWPNMWNCQVADERVMKVLLSAQRVKFMKNWEFAD